MIEKGAKTMKFKSQSRGRLLYLAVSVAMFALATAAPVPAAADGVTITVTAVGKKQMPPPPIKKDDVELFQGKERTQIADWRRGETLFLAILIDDSLDRQVAGEWKDLKAFIDAQPQSTYVAVAYARNGTAAVAQDFTNDHALAAKALRIPVGGQGAFTSPYLSLQDWLKRWPTSGGDRRSIIMISSGVDYFRGSFDPIDPDLESTIERAQRENVNVWTIYYPDEGHVGRRQFRVFNAQGNLSRLSEETGAESFYLDFGVPVSLKQYFDEIQDHLNNQYLLTFDASGGGKKGKFERVRVATEIPNIEFMTPSEVFLPAR
jgi:VWFA-related protein